MTMTTSVSHRLTDEEIQAAVQRELERTADVDAAGIGVAVEDGTVALSGEVDTLLERIAAKSAALRVHGVMTLIDKLVVHPRSGSTSTETDIAKRVERTLRAAANVPDTVQAEISGHEVTLRGKVEWDFERRAAERAIRYLRGVTWVSNNITLTPRPSAADTEQAIVEAFARNAQLNAEAIQVRVCGDVVTLTGTVRTYAEKQQAGQAGWSSPFVAEVRNELRVRGY